MFTDRLDSFTGVLEEIVERRNRVALFSYHSAPQIAKLQKDLQAELSQTIYKSMFKHTLIKNSA